MAEETTFSTGSLQTFVAGAFIVALLALGMSIYNFSRTTAAVSALLDLQAAAVTAHDGPDDDMKAAQEKMAAMEARMAAMEATMAAMPAMTPAPATP